MSDATTPVDKVTGEPSKNALSPEATARAAEVSAVPSGLCIVVKAASQSVPDMVVDCLPDWTVKDLKHFLSEEHSLKPAVKEQRLIYSGHLMNDDSLLTSLLKHSSSTDGRFVLHLVCTPSRQPMTSNTPGTSNVAHPHTSASQPSGSSNTNNNFYSTGNAGGVRQRLNAGPAGDDWMQNMFSANLPADDLRAHADAYKQYYENYMRSYMAYLQSVGSADGSNESAILAAWRQQLLATQQLPAATSNDTPDQQPPAEAQPLQAPQAIVDELPIADEDAVAHDWLDSLYVLVRFGILVFFVYIYSSIYRFFIIIAFCVLLYLYRVGWFRALGLPAEEAQVREARQQQQAQQRQPQQQQPRAPPAEEQQPPAAPAARATNAAANEIIDPNPPVSGDASSSSAATTPDVPAPGTSNDTNATSNDATSAASGASAGTNNAPHNEDVRLPETAPVVTGPEPAAPAVSFLTLSWTFFSALLTSLVPDQQETAPVVTGPEPAAPAVSFLTLSWTFFSALLTSLVPDQQQIL
ncbi:homocysteine-responsive endoplasmic reticulum-resident ubiquitin-like domain member 2 protein [Hyalella azteca]|uniref:Homocysteine-responsive endoplasmic reticulum-resident ubiquitin-like domain member 2 protein n=1 Tax=Hyalella azteca TaxID=294128 RepID=A0A8B7P3Y2_HYAAZ|nr:homocysteine-responsive endoplasmic reticulum-resident ubiquitin-like domain member 2 protein [Hyalella azteca]